MSNYQANDFEEVAWIFKALSSPRRLKLLLNLAPCCGSQRVLALPDGQACGVQQGCCCVSEMGAGLDISPSTLSHHVKELSAAGLIETTKRGKYTDCRLNEAALKKVLQLIGHLLGGDPARSRTPSSRCVTIKQRTSYKEAN